MTALERIFSQRRKAAKKNLSNQLARSAVDSAFLPLYATPAFPECSQKRSRFSLRLCEKI
jgi:hypothetical protein